MKAALKHFCAVTIGCTFGSFIFLVLVVFVFGNPLKDWLGSVFGIFVSRSPTLQPHDWENAIALMRKGLIISPSEIVSNITSIYGTMIQVLLGVFAVFGILSFASIRWQSIQQAETFAEEKIDKAFSSEEFKKRINDAASSAFDLQSEPLQESLADLANLSERITALESAFAANAPENEPNVNAEDEQ